MKTNLLKYMAGICFGLLTVSLAFAGDNYKTVKVKAPFPMQPIKIFIYPDKDFPITDYGAQPGGEADNTKAIAAAIEACNQAGGGRVVSIAYQVPRLRPKWYQSQQNNQVQYRLD